MDLNTLLIEKKSLRWCGIIIILLSTLLGLFEKIELITLDLRYQLASSDPNQDILLVVIDKESLKQYPQWPWPRHYYAEVISTLNQGGAKLIGLDFDFSSKSIPSEDHLLVTSVREAGNVVLSTFHEDKTINGGIKINSASLPFTALADAATGIGSILFPIDPDGKIRRANWVDSIQGEPIFSLSTELARKSLNLSKGEINISETNTVQIGKHRIDLQSDGTFYVNFIGQSQHYATVSFGDILGGQVDPTIFQDKIVLIGATAIELRDIWASPFGLMPGLEIQANTLQTLLSGQTVRRTPLWTTLLMIIGSALILDVSLTTSFKRDRMRKQTPFVWFSIQVLMITLFYGIGVFYAFKKRGLILDIVPVLSAVLIHYLFSSYAMNLSTSRSVQIKTMRLSTLHSVGALGLKEQPLERSLTFIFEMLKELLSIQTMILEIYQPNRHEFIKRIVKGCGEETDNHALMPECLKWVEKTYNSKDSVIVPNLKQVMISQAFSKSNIRASLFVPLITHDKQIGVLHLHSQKHDPFDEEAIKLLSTVTNQLAMNIENLDLIKEVNQLLNSSIIAFSSALELRDDETEGHSQRVSAYATEVGKMLKLDEHGLDALRKGALLHDIGKIGIPDDILRKPGKLDRHEMEIMKNHPEYGYRMLQNANFPEEVARILFHHHEQFDGSGYPNGLMGNDIIIYSRIFAVVDTYDAICSNRPYREGKPYEAAVDEIIRYSGSQFDPKVVEAFTKISKEQFSEIRYKVDEMVKERGLSKIIRQSTY